MNKKWRYTPFILASIFSFFIGFDFWGMRAIFYNPTNLDISGTMEIFVSLILMALFFILFSIIYALKYGFNPFFMAKSFFISVTTIILLSAIFLVLSASESGIYLNIHMMECDDCINVTEEELKKFPELWDGVQHIIENETSYSVRISEKRWDEIRSFLEEKGGYSLSYGGKCFRVGIIHVD